MGKPLRVLVVEDSQDDAELILEQLREGGYEPIHERVETAEAMAAALDSQPWDVVIADHLMPRFDSLAALSVLKSSGLDLPFIIVSGVIGEDVAVEAMRLGAHDYLMKDRLARLAPAVEQAIREAQVRREKREAEEALRVLNQTLEKRVEERTAELAAERAREHEARESAEAAARRLRAFQYVADATLSDLPLEDLLQELLRRLRQVLCADTASILLLTEDGKNLAARASSGLEEEVRERVQIPMGEGIAGRVAATGKPVIVEEVSQAEAVSPILRKRVRSILGAPLKTEGRLIGVVHVGTVAQRRFSQHDLRLMQLVAVRAASAIERGQSEEAVRKLSAAVEQSPVTVMIADTLGNLEYVNPKFSELTGYTSEEILGKNPRFLKSGHTTPEEYKELWDTITSGRIWRGHFLNRKKNGELYWESASIAPITNSEGAITHFVAVKQDITDRKQAEAERARLLAEVQHRAAELDTIFASIADGVIIYNPAGKILRMNPAADRMSRYTAEELELSLEDRLARRHIETPEGKPFPVDQFPQSRAVHGETVQGVLGVYHLPDGETRWLSISAAPIISEDGRVLGAVGTFVDITEQHKLQEEREDLVRMVSHDLRSPLTSVQGQAQMIQMLLQRGGRDEQLQRSVEAILVGARRMNAMIQDLVDLARLESGQMKLNCVSTEVASFALHLKARLSTALDTSRLWVEMPESPTVALADQDRLERILTNLLSNALKYSEGQVTIRVEKADREVKVSVIDRGAGIAAEDLPHMFERFYRAKGARKAEGLGLGLYISRLLVEAMGGRIWVESQVGQGSTFTFTLLRA